MFCSILFTCIPKLRLAQLLDKACFSWFGFISRPRLTRVMALTSSHESTITPQAGSPLQAPRNISEPIFISSCFKIATPYGIAYWFQFLVWVMTLALVDLRSADTGIPCASWRIQYFLLHLLQVLPLLLLPPSSIRGLLSSLLPSPGLLWHYADISWAPKIIPQRYTQTLNDLRALESGSN